MSFSTRNRPCKPPDWPVSSPGRGLGHIHGWRDAHGTFCWPWPLCFSSRCGQLAQLSSDQKQGGGAARLGETQHLLLWRKRGRCRADPILRSGVRKSVFRAITCCCFRRRSRCSAACRRARLAAAQGLHPLLVVARCSVPAPPCDRLGRASAQTAIRWAGMQPILPPMMALGGTCCRSGRRRRSGARRHLGGCCAQQGGAGTSPGCVPRWRAARRYAYSPPVQLLRPQAKQRSCLPSSCRQLQAATQDAAQAPCATSAAPCATSASSAPQAAPVSVQAGLDGLPGPTPHGASACPTLPCLPWLAAAAHSLPRTHSAPAAGGLLRRSRCHPGSSNVCPPVLPGRCRRVPPRPPPPRPPPRPPPPRRPPPRAPPPRPPCPAPPSAPPAGTYVLDVPPRNQFQGGNGYCELMHELLLAGVPLLCGACHSVCCPLLLNLAPPPSPSPPVRRRRRDDAAVVYAAAWSLDTSGVCQSSVRCGYRCARGREQACERWRLPAVAGLPGGSPPARHARGAWQLDCTRRCPLGPSPCPPASAPQAGRRCCPPGTTTARAWPTCASQAYALRAAGISLSSSGLKGSCGWGGASLRWPICSWRPTADVSGGLLVDVREVGSLLMLLPVLTWSGGIGVDRSGSSRRGQPCGCAGRMRPAVGCSRRPADRARRCPALADDHIMPLIGMKTTIDNAYSDAGARTHTAGHALQQSGGACTRRLCSQRA